MSIPSSAPVLSPAGFAIDPLGLGSSISSAVHQDKDASAAARSSCLHDYCVFLCKRLSGVARDPSIPPEDGRSGNSPFIHSSVLCSAGAGGCEEALLGVANLRGILSNRGTSCERVPHSDSSRADTWRLHLTSGGMLELLGRQNSTSCAFVIGCAGSGKTQFLLTMARQCATAAISDSQVLVPVFLKPGFCSGAFDTAESQSRVVEDLVRHSVCALVCGNGMRAEDISAADLSSLDGAGNASTGNRGCMSPSAFADALIKSLLALCLSRRLLVIYDANDLGHRADAAALFRACKAGCHIVISGHDNSIMDAWAIEACNSSLKTAHALPSLQLIMLQPLRGSTVISGVECDPVCLLGERSCAGIRSWWLLQNAVRFLMTTTPHNRHIATGRIPPFGPALRLQTWNRLIFDSMNWNTARLNAHALVYADASPSATNVSFECVRDTLLLLGRVAFSQKVKGNCVTDASFVQWLMEMPAFVGCSAPAAWTVLLALKRSGLFVNEAAVPSSSDGCFRICCPGVADASLSLLTATRISAKLCSLWAWQSDASIWNQILCAPWLHQLCNREWLVFTFLRLKEATRQRAILSRISSTDPTNADACILVRAYESILTEQSDSSVCPDSNFIDGSVAPASDDVQAILAPSLESAQHDFLMRIRELIKAPWWIAAALKGSTSASKWIRNVVLDCVFLLQIDSAAIIKALSHLLDSSQPSTSIAAKIGAACTLGRIGVSASSVVALFKCLCSSGVHDELRKQCMLSLLYISNGLLSDNGEAVGFAVESSGVALNLLLVAAVRFSSDVNRDVSAIARTICQDHVSLLVAFINETQHPHYLAENWLVSGDCACASASAASTILSLQGNESVTEALLHLLRRGDKVASISAASALSTVADPSMRVVQACTEAFLNQHGGGDKHWSAARKVLAKTLCDLVSRGVCPSAIYSMCDVVVNGLEKVLGVSNREEQLREVVMTSTLTDVLRVVSLASQDKSRRYEIVNSESEIRKNDECVTFILRRDVVEAQRLAMHVVGSHAAAHGWTEGLLGIITAGDELQNTIQMYDAALVSLSATAMSDNHDLQPDALATVLTFLKLKAVPAAADAVISWMLERLTRETEVLHDFMNSVPAEARFDRLKKVDKQDFMDFTIKDMFLPPDMQMQSVLVSKWQCDGQGAWLQLLGRCKLVLAALRSDFLGRYAKCLATVFEMCAFALQKLSNCLDMYELPIKRIALVDAVLGYWAAVNSCRFFSECSSCWAVAILSTSTSLTFGTVSPPFIPRFPSLIDERVVDSVKTHLFLVCASVREMRGEKSVESNAFGTFANLKDEFWRITVHLAANDASTLHRAQWLRAAVAIALESGSSDWAAEARGLLLSGLMDPTKAVRQVSAELFSSFKDHRAELVRLLHPYMVSESPDCRLRGIEASLVLYSNPARNADEVRANDIEAYVALLAGMLDDDDVSVRCAVVDALAHVDVQGIHFRKILSMLEDPTVEVRLAAARVVVGRKLKDVGVASVILEAIASRKSRTVNIHLAQLQAVDAISQVGANNPEEWASLLRCIGIALSDSSEDMSTMAFAALAKGAGLNVRSAHAAMDVIPLLNDSVACGPAVQLLGSFCERFCSLPPERCTPSAPATLASHVPSANDIMSRCILHLDARIRPLPAACCRGFSDAAVASKAKQHEALMLWWFCRLQGLVPFSDVDCLNSLQWIDE